MKRGTLTELARLTGFSKTTISRVLSGKADEHRVSNETARRILAIHKLMAGETETRAQRLRNNSEMTLGLAVPAISNPFFADLASAIISESHKHGFSVTIFDTQENSAAELEALSEMLGRRVDGIILVPCGERADELESIKEKAPLLLVDRYFKKSHLPYVASNNFDGGCMAMKQLLEAGHRSILVIEGPSVSVTTRERERGCKAAIRGFGERCDVFYRGNDFSIDNGYLQTRLLGLLQPRPTAIFAMSNTILLGAMQALRELRLRVPDDISIISYDDMQYLDYLNPPITRIAQPLKTIGRTAVKIMIESIAANRPITSQILMSPTLVEKESIRRC